ncbi:uncharacterized protein MKZ38_010479 [Zalerion maritima]|uniref:ADF-H domain-containing protein n=1 Tax=Zalerion maritima TaxID=339359 RepID=A0AAD5WSG2_9PEZI|nr:uncharacterized protein MKZ38_010479 [Zalerion maritima]
MCISRGCLVGLDFLCLADEVFHAALLAKPSFTICLALALLFSTFEHKGPEKPMLNAFIVHNTSDHRQTPSPPRPFFLRREKIAIPLHKLQRRRSNLSLRLPSSPSTAREKHNPVRNLIATMSGLEAEDIQAAYTSVRSDKEEPNWFLLSYASTVGDRLTLTACGVGGLSELVSNLKDDQAQYGYVRVEYANDSESKRIKFALITWIGENTKVMRKARVSIESGGVKAKFGHHIGIEARDRSELDEKEVVTRMRKAGGADYNGGRG